MNESSPTDGLGFRLHHVMLPVAQLERSVAFYTRLLGMNLKEQRDRRKRRVALVGNGTPAAPPYLELIENRSASAPDQLTPLTPTSPSMSGLRARIDDPDGNPLELAERLEF